MVVLGEGAVSYERGTPVWAVAEDGGADHLPNSLLKRLPGPTPHTPHPTPYTLNSTPYTLHPTPYTLHPTPYILHPTPNTRYMKDYQVLALHPQPSTLNPGP